MFDIYDLLTFTLFLGLVLWWWHISGQKAKVLHFTNKYCEQRGYQFLDQTLAFKRYTIIRDGLNRPFICRQYVFDFSVDGTNRYDGEVSINGRTIVRIVLDADQIEISDFP